MVYTMPMQASRVDSNQPEIVATLRGMGCTVQHLHAVGGGCPDLLIGVVGFNLLIEVKTQSGAPNEVQQDWHKKWSGQIAIIRSCEEAADMVRELWSLRKPSDALSKWHRRGSKIKDA